MLCERFPYLRTARSLESHPKEIANGLMITSNPRKTSSFPSPTDCMPTAPQVKAGTPHFHGHTCIGGPTRSECDSAAETPIPREPDSKNEVTITTTQTTGETWENTVSVWLREAAGDSGKFCLLSCSDLLPDTNSAKQMLSALSSAEGNGHVAGELHPRLCWRSGC